MNRVFHVVMTKYLSLNAILLKAGIVLVYRKFNGFISEF